MNKRFLRNEDFSKIIPEIERFDSYGYRSPGALEDLRYKLVREGVTDVLLDRMTFVRLIKEEMCYRYIDICKAEMKGA